MPKKNNTDTESVAASGKELVPASGQPLTVEQIENMIFTIRGVQVIVDRDLAMLYGVETKRMNEQVRRNLNRFPSRFRFQLTKEEVDEVVANCDHLLSIKYSPTLPYVFTEQGVAMLASVLRSETAVDVSIQIMDAFVAMRHFLISNAAVFQRIENLEQRQIATDQRIDRVFQLLEAGQQPQQGIFFDGQIFDAHTFVSDLIRSAKKRIVLFDNYVDDTVLALLDKRKKNVEAEIYTKAVSRQLSLDIARHNAQYRPIAVTVFDRTHDRFLCIDNTVYHIGASLKDLGKKWCAFSKMEMPASELTNKI